MSNYKAVQLKLTSFKKEIVGSDYFLGIRLKGAKGEGRSLLFTLPLSVPLESLLPVFYYAKCYTYRKFHELLSEKPINSPPRCYNDLL